jgi:cyclic pyranopterin phosphate synthase
MPEEGINYAERKELLTYEEMLRLVGLVVDLGVTKLRITGGEPFIRKDMMKFLRNIAELEQLKEIHITTNGTLTRKLLPELKALGIASINLSLDTLDEGRFFSITRRNEFQSVMETLQNLLDLGIKTKINMVVMDGRNIEDILPMIALSIEENVSVRFIEEMPFNGTEGRSFSSHWNHIKILEHIKSAYKEVDKLPDPPFSTSMNYKIKGAQGSFGIIAAYSRTFCGSCNRLRVTPQGTLKTCLYDSGVFNLKSLMRSGASDEEVKSAIIDAVNHRDKDGFEAEQNRFKGLPISESMSTIGG